MVGLAVLLLGIGSKSATVVTSAPRVRALMSLDARHFVFGHTVLVLMPRRPPSGRITLMLVTQHCSNQRFGKPQKGGPEPLLVGDATRTKRSTVVMTPQIASETAAGCVSGGRPKAGRQCVVRG